MTKTKKKAYLKPEASLVRFSAEDILVSSPDPTVPTDELPLTPFGGGSTQP